jgi:hypothetical protein
VRSAAAHQRRTSVALRAFCGDVAEIKTRLIGAFDKLLQHQDILTVGLINNLIDHLIGAVLTEGTDGEPIKRLG